MSLVPQEPYLFDGTILENIHLARQNASPADVQRAAELAQVDAFVKELPKGLATQIGERGLRLSGGQVQRIALARAFLKDAPLLILDEATANLDPENEILIRRAVGELARGRSTLMIAHRLGTVIDADQILVMVGGQILEAGSHEELMEKAGIYSRMVIAYHGSTSKSDLDTNTFSEAGL